MDDGLGDDSPRVDSRVHQVHRDAAILSFALRQSPVRSVHTSIGGGDARVDVNHRTLDGLEHSTGDDPSAVYHDNGGLEFTNERNCSRIIHRINPANSGTIEFSEGITAACYDRLDASGRG